MMRSDGEEDMRLYAKAGEGGPEYVAWWLGRSYANGGRIPEPRLLISRVIDPPYSIAPETEDR
jgi:hypothetical protein